MHISFFVSRGTQSNKSNIFSQFEHLHLNNFNHWLQVPLAVCSALLFQHVTQGSGSVVRRRRVRKLKHPQEIQRSGKKLDLDKISINQDFNTEFVKAFLYRDSPRSIEKEEGVRPIFATRQGEHRVMKVILI